MKIFYIVTTILAITFLSCSKNEKDDTLSFTIDKEIKNSNYIKRLNDSLEYKFGRKESVAKRSSNIVIDININDTINKIKKLKANATFLNTYYFGKDDEELQSKKSDTLAVYIDNFDGYSSEGIKILIHQNKYDIKYFMNSDVILSTKRIEITKINSSKLILDKRNYKTNDSIYGYLEANLLYQNRFSLPQKIKVQGYFRTQIKENNY